MKHGNLVNITYQSYWRKNSNTFDVEPYCVKLFKQRWYLIARSPYYDKVMTYALDRILDLEVLADEKFSMPDTFIPSEFFEEYYGVVFDKDLAVEKIKLKVSADQANYLRSLPLHHSQREMQTTDKYSIFELELCPTYDFYQEILRNGEKVEVLEPLWLRKEIAGEIENMWNKYKS